MPIPSTDPGPGAGIESFFSRKGFLRRAQRCFLATLWPELIASMSRRGYTHCGIYTTLRHSSRFCEFAASEGVVESAQVTDELVTRYLDGLDPRLKKRQEPINSLLHLTDFLRDRGDLPPKSIESPIDAEHPLVEEFAEYLVRHRNISESRLQLYRGHLIALLNQSGCQSGSWKPLDLEARAVFEFVTDRARALKPSSRKAMCAGLRSFLRFLYVKQYLSSDLASCVPVIPSFRLDRLPRVIEPEAVHKILDAIDRTTSPGRRDYAMLLVLGTYGLRAGQLCALKLEDIDWRRETLRVPAAKRGRDVVLPLRPEVGEAISEYLRHDRPVCSFREIFLRVRAPLGPLGGHLTGLIRPYASKAGLNDIPTGPHAWRHACATRMLASGESLKTIRDILGHRNVETTFIYTKVDIESLRQAALEWPGGKQS